MIIDTFLKKYRKMVPGNEYRCGIKYHQIIRAREQQKNLVTKQASSTTTVSPPPQTTLCPRPT